ncbi:MAG TPA: hypothetical protein VJ817_00290, partial [Gemmatimonadales bacterium]|nr:hypothetical protein [Gemmatimonadales bacterium]
MTSLPPADLLRLVPSGPPVGRCLDELELARFAEGKAEGAARVEAIAHLADCEVCRKQLTALVVLLGEPVVAAEVPRPEANARPPMRAMLGAAGLVAVAATLLLLVLPREIPVDPNALRDPTLTATTAPVAIEPVGEVRQARTLTWNRVDGASSYRATLFDSTGTVLFELQLSDTVARIPDSVRLVPH